MTESSPPRPFTNTPNPPPGNHDLRSVGVPPKVFIDTNTFFRSGYRAPLLASCLEDDLIVYWSERVQEEVVRVAERIALAAAQRAARNLTPDMRAEYIQAAMTRGRAETALLIETAKPIFQTVDSEIPSVGLDVSGIPDPDDRHHVLAAHTVGAPYFLTLDERHLPHGLIVAGIQFWHPDTFLTLFYQQNPDAYRRARARLTELPRSLLIPLHSP